MRNEIETAYRQRHPLLERLADSLCTHVADCLQGQPRIDRISARAKDIERFVEKACMIEGDSLKYDSPLTQIQDQLGARIVVFYKSDVDRIDAVIKRYFTAIEYRRVVPDRESEFGYFGQHLILTLPADIIEPTMDKTQIPGFFELQIKTLFQHAWSEANHDLGYKSGFGPPLTAEQERLIAFTSAQGWGADRIFQQLAVERKIIPN